MAGQRLTISTALLQQAWAITERGPTWPATLSEAERHPLYSRLLRATACRLAQQQQRAAAASAHGQHGRMPLHTAVPALQHQQLDLKRRAAGDRDDD
jgi:hypothetical protein